MNCLILSLDTLLSFFDKSIRLCANNHASVLMSLLHLGSRPSTISSSSDGVAWRPGAKIISYRCSSSHHLHGLILGLAHAYRYSLTLYSTWRGCAMPQFRSFHEHRDANRAILLGGGGVMNAKYGIEHVAKIIWWHIRSRDRLGLLKVIQTQ